MDFLSTKYDPHKKIWSGAKQHLYHNFDCSLGRILFTSMRNYPKNICQINDVDGKALTNQEALTWAVRIAQHFKKMHLTHDDVIGISARNTTYVLSTALACFMNCTPFHSINPLLDEKNVTHLFGLTKPKVIFCEGSEYHKIFRATKALKPLIYTLTDHIEGVPRVEQLLEPTKTELFYMPEKLVLGGEQTIAILCSSGTTGLPKAVCMSNYCFTEAASFVTSEDVAYNSSGLDWISGVFMLVTCCVSGCTRIITNKPYTPEYFVELVKKYKVTNTIIAPRHASTLASCETATPENLASLKFILLGGGVCNDSTINQLQQICKNAYLLYGYGLTEANGVSFNTDLSKTKSVGKLLDGVRVRIVDENGQNLSHNDVGEICVHTGRVWNGYYNNPMESRRMQDSLGWFHSGDLGYFDADNNLYVIDRKKDTLKYQGMHYWSTEIEQVIAELPEVADVCVVGIYDERNGDAAGAVVVKVPNTQLTEATIKAHVAERLPVSYKQLHAGVRFVEKLPQNANGKTIKKEAKAFFQ